MNASFFEAEKAGAKLWKFNGEEGLWPEWNPDFQGFLNSADSNLLDLLKAQPDLPPVDRADERALHLKRSRNIYWKLVFHTTGIAKGVVMEHKSTEDGIAAWNQLCEKYEQKGLAGKVALNKMLLELVMKPSEDPDNWLVKFNDVLGQLLALGQKYDDAWLVVLVLSNLPSTYDTLGILLQHEDGITYELVRRKIRDFWKNTIMRTDTKQADAAKALAAQHVPVHQPWYGDAAQAGGSDGSYGYGDDRGGYRGRGGGGRRGRHRGGRGGNRGPPDCYNCGKLGHKSHECRAPRKGAANVASAASAKQPSHYAAVFVASVDPRGAVSDNPDAWIVDSGATAHMVSSIEGLTDVRDEMGIVVVANKQVMESVAFGQLEVDAVNVAGTSVKLLLKDVLVVPELSCNLFSVRKVEDYGGSVHFGAKGRFISMKGLKIPFRSTDVLYELDLRAEAREPASVDPGVEATEPASVDPRVEATEPASVAPQQAMTASVAEDMNLWRRRFGHRHHETVMKLGLGQRGGGKCDICEVAKHTHRVFPQTVEERKTTVPFELVHTDLLAVEQESLAGSKYAVMFTDDATRYRKVYFMPEKSSTLECFKQYVADIAGLQGGVKIKTVSGLRSYNGGEFTGDDFKAYCKQKGIRHTTSGPYAPQQNGVAERGWRTIVESARSMLTESGLGKEFCADAVSTAVYLTNLLPTRALGDGIPHKAVFKEQAKVDHLRVFGCKVWAQVYDHQLKKMDPKAWRGIHVGYHESNRSCYRVYDPMSGRIKHSVHVTFDEKVFPARQYVSDSDDERSKQTALQQAVQPQAAAQQQAVRPQVEQQPVAQQQAAQQQQVRQPVVQQQQTAQHRGALQEGAGGTQQPVQLETVGDAEDQAEQVLGPRNKTKLCRVDGCRFYGYPHLAHANLTIHSAFTAHSAFVAAEALSYEGAPRSEDAPKWLHAMDEEFEALKETKTLQLCELPPGAKVIGSRWVLKEKRDQTGSVVRHKARLVAQGLSQQEGLDYFDTYAPVAKLTSVRSILAVAAAEDLGGRQHGCRHGVSVEEEIYVRQPKGYELEGPNGEQLVCRVHKSLYGLKQSPRNWNLVIDQWLCGYGLVPSAADPCMYVKGRSDAEGGMLVVALYVDDLLIAGSQRATVDQFKLAIADRFKMKDLGHLRWMLGMEVRRDRSKRTLEILQTAYIDQVLANFGMADCKPVTTPSDGVLIRLEPHEVGGVDPEYQRLVGSLHYAAIVTRPDISFDVQSLSKHLLATGERHWVAAKRVLRYLKGTRELGIMYNIAGARETQLVGYCDSDWGGDQDKRRSTTAYVFMLAGGAVSWTSKLQATVALSSAEAEYMAACAAAQEAVYMRRMLEDLVCVCLPTVLFEDNQGAIALAKNPVLHKKTKHIDIRYHFTRQCIERGEIELVYVPTEHQLADLLTKPLGRVRVVTLREQVLGYKA